MLPPPRPPIKTVLVGFGHGGRVFHAPLIRHDPGFALAVVVNPGDERRRAAQETYPDAVVVRTLEEALDAVPDAELAVITTPNATHVPLTTTALERGLHVVVDKPFVVHGDDGERLIEAARAAGRLLVPFHNRRWDGDFLAVRSSVESGRLGSVRLFESAIESWKPDISKQWKREARPDAGGGILYDLGPHLVDQALVLFGPARPVFAELRRDRTGAVAEDSVFLVLAHDGGVTSHLHAGTLVPQARPRFRVSGNVAGLSITGSDPQEGLLAAGVPPADIAAAGAGVDRMGRRGLLGRDGDTEPLDVAPGSYVSFYSSLASAIHGTGPVPVAAEDAVAVVRIIEQVHESYPVVTRPQRDRPMLDEH